MRPVAARSKSCVLSQTFSSWLTQLKSLRRLTDHSDCARRLGRSRLHDMLAFSISLEGGQQFSSIDYEVPRCSVCAFSPASSVLPDYITLAVSLNARACLYRRACRLGAKSKAQSLYRLASFGLSQNNASQLTVGARAFAIG